jgi:transposase
MKNACHDTDLTAAQGQVLRPQVPKAAKRGRPPTDPRGLLDAMLCVVKSGCQWRGLPKTFPPWQTVCHVFGRWSRDGPWEWFNARRRALVRAAAGKACRPSAGILDSQSGKSDPHGGAGGHAAAQKIQGRTRHLLVATRGLVLGVAVTPASTPARAGGPALLATGLGWLTWFKRLWVDGGYAGADFAAAAREFRPKLVGDVVKRSDTAQGFAVRPQRGLVERTCGRLLRHRRLVRDDERTEASAEAWGSVARIRIMRRRPA